MSPGPAPFPWGQGGPLRLRAGRRASSPESEGGVHTPGRAVKGAAEPGGRGSEQPALDGAAWGGRRAAGGPRAPSWESPLLPGLRFPGTRLGSAQLTGSPRALLQTGWPQASWPWLLGQGLRCLPGRGPDRRAHMVPRGCANSPEFEKGSSAHLSLT